MEKKLNVMITKEIKPEGELIVKTVKIFGVTIYKKTVAPLVWNFKDDERADYFTKI